VIRLHGPWDVQGSTIDGAAKERTIRLPVDLESVFGATWPSPIVFRRRFGCPSNLGPSERVELVIEPINPRGDVSLNEESLGSLALIPNPTRFDITKLLEARNQIELKLDVPSSACSSRHSLDVRLEISAT
jgi:hypothetical protein